jgi:predicted nucleic acid-binding protein
MILLDTNVISELLRPSPEQAVLDWMSARDGDTLYLSAVTEAELRYGAAILPGGRRKVAINTVIDEILREDFAGRILPFDSPAAVHYAEIAADRKSAGRPISQFDCQIAAIARANAMAVATRNGPDFEGCGLNVVNPWIGA